jgi:hypothetical protein
VIPEALVRAKAEFEKKLREVTFNEQAFFIHALSTMLNQASF